MKRQVRDMPVKIENYSKGIYNSLSPLTCILNLFVINSNVENAAYSKTCYISKCLLAMSFFGSLNMFCLYYKNAQIYKFIDITSSVKLTDAVQALYDVCQYMVDLCFVYKYGRHISLEYFRQYERIDEILGVNYYSKMKWELLRLLSFFTFIWLLISTCDFVAWFLHYGWIISSIYAVAYIFMYIKILTTLDLSSHVMQIQFRLMIIGDTVHYYYSITESTNFFKGNFVCDNNWLYANVCSQTLKSPRVIATKVKPNDGCAEIKLLSRCYLQLIDQVECINMMFGLRILLNSLSLLIDIIRFTNIAIRMALGTQILPGYLRYLPVVTIMMRQVTCVLVLFNLVNHCEKVYRERDRIIDTIDHLFINKNPSDKLRVAMTELRGLMQARPINFNLAHFFRLEYGFLVSIASVVVTYTIILLQTMN